jgi:pimeloyl-ACP methyl ester carboxylesterase
MPETHYARSGDVSIAYQVVGGGVRDLVFVPGIISHVEFFHELPGYTEFLEALGAFARVIVFDKRGNGMSDRVAAAPTLEERMDDIRAVMDAVGSERAALFGVSEGGPLSILYAASHPGRVDALVLFETFVRFGGPPDRPSQPGGDLHSEWTRAFIENAYEWWGTGVSLDFMSASLRNDPHWRNLCARAERLSGSPGNMRSLFEMVTAVDVSGALPSVRAPCLVMHGGAGSLFVEHGRHLVEHLPDARLAVVEGADHYPWFAKHDRIVPEVEEFLTGARSAIPSDRQLATVLFTDIVGSTERAAELGDRQWYDLLQRHHGLVRRQLERFRGREIDFAGDGVFACFDGPARALCCACAIRDGVRSLGLEIRAGVHTGEVECREEKVSGLAVHIGARVGGLAAPGEVLASRTVKDLVVGSGIAFDDRGTHELKGVPDVWQLYAVAERRQ